MSTKTNDTGTGEIWKDIAGFEGHYQVSNFGRIKSCDRILPHKIHGTWHIKERILKPHWNGAGRTNYQVVHLHVGNGRMRCVRIHRVVAETFIPNPQNLPQVNHIDGDKKNNFVQNLEWVSSEENVAHSWKTGLCNGIVNAKRKPVFNLDTGETFNSIADAERSYGGSIGTISHVLCGTRKTAHGCKWAYVKEE